MSALKFPLHKEKFSKKQLKSARYTLCVYKETSAHLGESRKKRMRKYKNPVRKEQTMSGRARVNGGDAAAEIYGNSYLIVHTKAIMG